MPGPELQKAKYILHTKMKVELHRIGADPLGGQTSIHWLSSSLVIGLQYYISIHLFPTRLRKSELFPPTPGVYSNLYKPIIGSCSPNNDFLVN